MVYIVDLPQDVLLELASLLKFDDLASLLSLCRAIRELQGQKTLWLDALHKIKEVENQPLPFTTWEALDAMTAQELQDVTWKAIRLMRTWRSDTTPRPVQIRTLKVEAGAKLVCIPGANFIVTHIEGGVSCWDFTAAQRVAHLEIPGLTVKMEACVVAPGRALIGASSIRYACFSLSQGEKPGKHGCHLPSHTSSAAMTVMERRPGPDEKYNFFIDSRVMGFRTDTTVTFWNMDSRVQPWIKRYKFDFGTRNMLPCLAIKQNVYLFSPAFFALHAEVHPMTLTFQDSDDQHESPARLATTVLGMPYPSELGDPADFFGNNWNLNPWTECTRGLSVSSPQYGVFAVHHRKINIAEHHLELVLFHSAHPTGEGDLEFGSGCCYQHAHARTHIIHEMVAGASGTYALLRFADGEENCFGLVHYSPTTALFRCRTRPSGNWT